MVEPGPEDANAPVEAAKLHGEAARHELVLEAPRSADRRQPGDPGHCCQAPREFLRVHQGFTGRVVHGDQDDRHLALSLAAAIAWFRALALG